MRAIKRWYRRWQALRAAQPQLEACRPHAERLLGGPVTWRRTGGCGRDVVCLALRDGRPAGVLRVTLPGFRPPDPAKRGNLPFVPLAPTEKIEREWHAYAAGSAANLTPQPLWRDTSTLLCAYVDGTPLKRDADAGRACYLDLATEALPQIARLHAIGLTHMDMSLSNILRARNGGYRFVDFEYGPAEGLTLEQQQLYDYLRLLESIWKYLPPEKRQHADATWGDTFRSCTSEAVQTADLSPLRPALGRILAAPELNALSGPR